MEEMCGELSSLLPRLSSSLAGEGLVFNVFLEYDKKYQFPAPPVFQFLFYSIPCGGAQE